MEAMYPDIPGDAAIDGTGSHLLLEESVAQNVKASYFVGRVLGEGHPDRSVGWTIDEERAARVQMCLDYLDRRLHELGQTVTKINSESQLHPGIYFGRDDWWGTGDLSLESPEVFEVIDYKDGRGWVSPESSQPVGYGAGLLATHICTPNPKSPTGFDVDLDAPGAPKTVRLTIVQPKTSPPVRYVDLPARELWGRAAKLAEAAYRTDDPAAPLTPDDKGGKGHCRWCKHRENCDALESAKNGEGAVALQQFTAKGGNVDIFDKLQQGGATVADLTADELADALDAIPAIKALCDSIEAEGTRREEATPGSVPTYGMGEGRKSRVWKHDEEETAKKLKNMRLKKEQIYLTKLASPAQIEKIDSLSEKQLARLHDELIEEKPGKPKLVKIKGAKREVSFAEEAAAYQQQVAQEQAAPPPPSAGDAIPDFF
jgi:hypothetical protein